MVTADKIQSFNNLMKSRAVRETASYKVGYHDGYHDEVAIVNPSPDYLLGYRQAIRDRSLEGL